MGFDSLLGNSRLKQNLSAGLARGRVSHFYLISGPLGSGKKTLARLLAAAMVCRQENKPCLTCPACRKAMADTHPDIITVTDPEHKTVAVDIVRQVREEMFVRPNEADRKIYIFPQALREEGQNALLKVLEEPPSYGVFILLSENPEQLLQTIRSRATELSLLPLDDTTLQQALQKEFPDAQQMALVAATARSGGYLGQAKTLLQEGAAVAPQTQSFIKSFCAGDGVGLLATLAPMQKWKREQVLEVLQQWFSVLQNALIFQSGVAVISPMAKKVSAARSGQDIHRAIAALLKATTYIHANVSVAAICDFLAWELR